MLKKTAIDSFINRTSLKTSSLALKTHRLAPLHPRQGRP